MKELTVYGRLYLEVFQKAFDGLKKNLWTVLLPVLLMLAMGVAGTVSRAFGMLGGILMSLATAAVFSCYLYFVGEIVSGSPVKFSELKRSVGSYFWAVINVMFIFWIARLAIQVLGGASAGVLMLALVTVGAIAFNAVPETLYIQGTHGGMATLQDSFEFLRDNLLWWAIPNVPWMLVLWAGPTRLTGLIAALGPMGPLLALVVLPLVLGFIFHAGMIFRGHLYKALRSSSHRQRMFRYGAPDR